MPFLIFIFLSTTLTFRFLIIFINSCLLLGALLQQLHLNKADIRTKELLNESEKNKV